MIKPVKTLPIIIASAFLTIHIAHACETDHWITSKSDDGEVIVLEDGSVWQVKNYDTITSRFWYPMDNIATCDDQLLDTDENEAVDADRVP